MIPWQPQRIRARSEILENECEGILILSGYHDYHIEKDAMTCPLATKNEGLQTSHSFSPPVMPTNHHTRFSYHH
jgi:hypothetical protein